MPNQTSWAAKYRPSKLSHFYGQKNAVDIVTGMIKRKEFPNAMLITGTTGIGKTTLGRLIAAKINNTVPIDNEDCIELNVGINNKVEDARFLTKRLDFAAKRDYKIFLLDEAHLFTRQAASALLKHIEEPPKHVVWILVTDQPGKLLDTIKGRCLVINLNRLSKNDLIKILKRITRKEKLKCDDKLISKVADYGDGKARDTIQLFQATANMVEAGSSPKESLDRALKQIRGLDEIAIKFLYGLYSNNLNLSVSAFQETQDYDSLLNIMTEMNEAVILRSLELNLNYMSPARIRLLDAIDINKDRAMEIQKTLIQTKLESYNLRGRDMMFRIITQL